DGCGGHGHPFAAGRGDPPRRHGVSGGGGGWRGGGRRAFAPPGPHPGRRRPAARPPAAARATGGKPLRGWLLAAAAPPIHAPDRPRRRRRLTRPNGSALVSGAVVRVWSRWSVGRRHATARAPVAQGIEQPPSKRLAAGSNPAWGAAPSSPVTTPIDRTDRGAP